MQLFMSSKVFNIVLGGIILDKTSAYLYLLLNIIYKVAENMVMYKENTKGLKNKVIKDKSALLIMIPFYIILFLPVLEFNYFKINPTKTNYIVGTVLFILATILRVKGHSDLKRGFSMFLEKADQQILVKTGIYKFIRHPLYLGNLFFFLACPTLLKARITWIAVVVGIIGIITRIKIEERYLLENMDGYEDYMKETWALIPFIY